MIGSKQLKVGMAIILNGELWRVMETHHTQPGKGGAYIQTKLRNILKGTQMEHRFRSGEPVERAVFDKRSAQFLYQDGNDYHFMDSKNYEQFHLTADQLGNANKFLLPNMNLLVESYEGKPLGVELPKTVQLKVIETEPYLKTATVTSSYKPAKLETGSTVQVPSFVVEGDKIEIDTASGEYVGRVK